MGAFEDILMFLGSTVCHQLEERSYFFDGVQMPLCARCIGIHFGFVLAMAYLLLGPKRLASKLPGTRQLVVLASIMAFFLIDAGFSYSGINPSDNLRRTLSGLALGVPLPFVLVPLLNLLSGRSNSSKGVFDTPIDWLPLPAVFVAALVAIVMAEDVGALFYPVSLIGVLGVFVFFISVVSVIVLIALEKNPMRVQNKIVLAAGIAVIVLFGLAALHRAFPTA
jgi:uncharacterized membrane protein